MPLKDVQAEDLGTASKIVVKKKAPPSLMEVVKRFN